MLQLVFLEKPVLVRAWSARGWHRVAGAADATTTEKQMVAGVIRNERVVKESGVS
jgi:hypothetical protein